MGINESRKVPPDAIQAFRTAAAIARDRAEDISTLAEPVSAVNAIRELADGFDRIAAGDADGFIEAFGGENGAEKG